jgi:hypothetical protein
MEETGQKEGGGKEGGGAFVRRVEIVAAIDWEFELVPDLHGEPKYLGAL